MVGTAGAVAPNDVALVIDAPSEGGRGARDIDRCEGPVLEQISGARRFRLVVIVYSALSEELIYRASGVTVAHESDVPAKPVNRIRPGADTSAGRCLNTQPKTSVSQAGDRSVPLWGDEYGKTCGADWEICGHQR